MRVFVTGATGWVGSAVVQELIGAGHQVLGLARSDASAQALAATGASVQRGELDDIDSLRSGASACDGVIHTAFKHDFSEFQANAELDRRVIEAIGDVLAGSGRPLVTTSGTLIVALGGIGGLVSEQDAPDASVPRIIDIARETGVSAFIGDGTNRWPAVHRLDAARAFRLALESGEAGSRYHAVGDEGIPVRQLAWTGPRPTAD